MGTLNVGEIFGGRYRIERLLAEGGMGAVYEVTHLETERRRALKVMHAHMLSDEVSRQRFRQEARVAAKVESEHIVDVFDAGVDPATSMPYLVMELLRGEELGARLERCGRLDPAEVVEHLAGAAMALSKTHRAGVVHRDLKPENLFITEREDGTRSVKILDFGIAKILAHSAAPQKATANVGTPVYMAPEQLRSGGEISPATDIYAFGMIAYALLVGHPYWRDELESPNLDIFTFASAVNAGAREAASARAARRGVGLPPEFDAFFARATALEPAERYATAREAAQHLAVALGVPLPETASRPSLPAADAYAITREVVPSSTTHAGVAEVHTRPPPAKPRWASAVVAVCVGLVAAGAVALRSSLAPTAASTNEEPAAAPASTSAPEPSFAPAPATSAEPVTEPEDAGASEASPAEPTAAATASGGHAPRAPASPKRKTPARHDAAAAASATAPAPSTGQPDFFRKRH